MREDNSGIVGIGLIAGAVVGGLLFLTAATGSWYTVNQTERAVVLRNGAVSYVAGPGMHLKMPYFDAVRRLSVKQTNVTWSGTSRIETYSRDQQPTDVALSVTYHIPESKVAEVYGTYLTEQSMIETIVHPRVLEQFKNVFGRFDAVTAIQERARLNKEAEDAIKAAINGPVVVDTVQILDVKFSGAYEGSVEARMTAQVEVQKLEQNLQREKIQAQIAVTQAQGRADSVKAEADAKAYATRATGSAEAAAIKVRGDALKDNPGLVNLTAAERWNGTLPTTMVPGSSVPFLNVGQGGGVR